MTRDFAYLHMPPALRKSIKLKDDIHLCEKKAFIHLSFLSTRVVSFLLSPLFFHLCIRSQATRREQSGRQRTSPPDVLHSRESCSLKSAEARRTGWTTARATTVMIRNPPMSTYVQMRLQAMRSRSRSRWWLWRRRPSTRSGHGSRTAPTTSSSAGADTGRPACSTILPSGPPPPLPAAAAVSSISRARRRRRSSRSGPGRPTAATTSSSAGASTG